MEIRRCDRIDGPGGFFICKGKLGLRLCLKSQVLMLEEVSTGSDSDLVRLDDLWR